MPYWIADSLAGIPVFLWIYVGLGGLWALAILPRGDWRRRIEVIAVAFAAGPGLLTAWMFVLGTAGASGKTHLLTEANVLMGTVVLAGIAAILVARKVRASGAETYGGRMADTGGSRERYFDEKLLIGLVLAALVVRWFVIAYWPFTAYDTFWVYGYQARLYALIGYIPQTIGYYPQFLSLQYAFAQLGGINDHMARAVLIFLHVASILAAYVLGTRLINRRTGLIAAVIWALYPSVGEWSRAGDLEIPLAFLFTLAAAFFLLAWRLALRLALREADRRWRTRYALIAGLLLGIGLWTKPTMGAFLLGVGLLLGIDLVRVGFDWQRWQPRLRVALLTGIAALPLGAVWYVRNLTLGLTVVVFPLPFWQTLAQRSGGEFGWLLAALVVWAIYLYRRYPGYNWRLGAVGMALVLAALVPTIIPQIAPNLLPVRRMSVIEFGLLAAGLVVLGVVVRRMARDLWDDELRGTAGAVGWGLALALPYFVTWFFSYSYHYRLSFAIVPLMILPSAAILARMFTPETVGRGVRAGVRRLAYLTLIVGLAIPGVISAVNDPNGGGDYLWTDKYPDDTARYRSGNPALMNVVDGLQIWIDQHPGEKLVVSAPGVDPLPFFFPLQDIRVDDPPTRLDQLDGVNYFVYGVPEGTVHYDAQGVPPSENQVINALGRTDIMRRAWGQDDGNFRYDVYELHLANRWITPTPQGAAPDDVVIGGFVRYLGYDIGGLDFWPDHHVIAHFFWQVLRTPPDDDTIYIHLRDPEGNLIATWDGPVGRGANGYYATTLWQPGEYISDERIIRLPDGVNPIGKGDEIVIGMYNSRTGERLPISVNGGAPTDGYVIENRIAIYADQPPG